MMMGYPMGAPRKMWFAEATTLNGVEVWHPCLQSDFAGITDLDIVFDDRETCEWFIRKHLVGAGWMDGPARYACPDCGAPPETWCRNFVSTTGEVRLSWHADRMRYQFGGWPA